jgi:hypothetical protein
MSKFYERIASMADACALGACVAPACRPLEAAA